MAVGCGLVTPTALPQLQSLCDMLTPSGGQLTGLDRGVDYWEGNPLPLWDDHKRHLKNENPPLWWGSWICQTLKY